MYRKLTLAAMLACAAAPAHAALLQNPASLQCMGLQAQSTLSGPYSLPCAATGLAQWTLVNGHIISSSYQVPTGGNATPLCMDLAGGVPGDPIVLNACSATRGSQNWVIMNGHIVNGDPNFSSLCMSRVNGRGKPISSETCITSGAGEAAQLWGVY